MPGQEPGAPHQVAAAHQQPQPPIPAPIPTQDHSHPQPQPYPDSLPQPPPPPQQQQQPQQPPQPTYPSLAYPPGPSQHQAPYPPNGYPYNPYYAAQQFPHHHGAQRPHHPNPAAGGFQPAFRYDNYPGYYQPQFYPPYGQMPVPGPGPGTMQNGYYVGGGGGGGANFQRGPYGGGGFEPDQQHKFGGHEVDDPAAAYHGNPPQFAPQQPFYPPGHPYAYGVGVGYQQQPGMFGGGGMGYRPDGGYMGDQPHQHQHHQHQPHGGPNGTSAPPASAASSKGLNPAAQGFSYPARKTEPLSRTTSAAHPPASQANGPQANGHASAPVVEHVAPAQVPEKARDAGSLGLSLEPPAPVSEPPAVPPPPPPTQPAPAPAAKPTRAPEIAASASTHPSPENTHDTPSSSSSSAPPPPLAAPSPVQPKGLIFTGPPLAGLTSPPSSSTMPRRPKNLDDPVCFLRPHRPAHDTEGNSFAAHLARSVPASCKTETLPAADGEGSSSGRRTTRGWPEPRGKAVYAVGVKGGRRAPPTLPLTFGDVISESLSPEQPVEESKPPVVATPTPATPAEASTPTPATAPPAPVRSPAPAPATVKPSSWASLLRSTHPGKSAAGTPNSLSVAASSTLPSPSKSIDSLPTESAASRVAASDGRSTPRSPPAAKPATFNYAAAVGAPPTPAEDLARLLTDGLSSRPAGAPAPIVPRGLINTGNMCFANTILQVLRYCTPFTELFEELGKRLKADLARRTPLLEAMVVFLREFVPGPSSNGSSNGTSTPKGKAREGNAFIPENVYDAMKENKRFDTMRRGYQEDAEEYLGFFLNTLHEELLDLYSRTAPAKPVAKSAAANGGDSERTIDRPVSPSSGRRNEDDDWLEVGKKQKTHVVRTAETRESAVSRIFGGSLRSVLHTPGSKDSVTLEPYQPLQLDIQAGSVHTLADALRHLNEPETVPGVWSAARGANVDATKQVFLEALPPVLILHLKRFVYDPQEQNVVKRAKPVAYGTELAVPPEIVSPAKRTPQGIRYRLFGVVYHHGHSATGGHYTVCVARPDGSGWLHFDDETVQPVASEDVVVSDEEAREGRAGAVAGREKCAYLLFYQRVR